MVSKLAVIGIDLGTADSFVGYVGKNVVDICQNEISKRNTPSLVGFTDRQRLLGDEAAALVKSNAKNSCRNFKHLLGQRFGSDYVQAEEFWSTAKLVELEDGTTGYDVMYKGEPRTFSSVQATAMFLTKLKDVTEKWTNSKVSDCVIGVPSFFSDVHRQALLDAAKIAGISVLRLMNEHTATALAYGIYRSNDFDEAKPQTVVFCSMGHSIFSVSVVQFVKGKLTVVCEKSDKVGGRDMDECLMREFAGQFKKKVGCDPLSNKKAMFKLEDAVLKCKKVLSANSEAPINCECLMEDEDFASNITRDAFETMCQPMMAKVQAVLDGVKALMTGIPLDSIDFVEVVGGATRVPWVKDMCSRAFNKELSTTMNADESVARGCALQAAILSPLYKVREFKIEEFSPYAVSIGWMGSAADAEAAAKEEDNETNMAAADGEYKTAAVFPANSAMNTLKMLTFYRKGPFEVKAEYADTSRLLPNTSPALGTYKVDLPPQTENKKVKVKVKLTLHGTFTVESAQLVEEEEYEVTVKEKREIEPSAEEKAAEAPAEEPKEGEAKDEKKEPEKKFEMVDVVKRKTRTKRTDLNVVTLGCPGLDATALQSRMDEETSLQAETREVIETDEKRNDLESYILNMRAKVEEGGECSQFITPADRTTFLSDLQRMEDWLYDEYDATKVMYVEKLSELQKKGEPVVWRYKESQIRGDWIEALSVTISNFRNAAVNPGELYGHIAPAKLQKVVQECDAASSWLADLQEKQAKLQKTDKPVLICADMEKKSMELKRVADEIFKEPKPKPAEPAKEEKKDDKKEAAEGEAPKDGEAKGDNVADVD